MSEDAVAVVWAPTVVTVAQERPTAVTVAAVGPQGPPGVAGAYHRHEQAVPASVVSITHNFGRWPSAVTLASLDGSITFSVFGVEMIDVNTVRISIDQPTAYVALIS